MNFPGECCKKGTNIRDYADLRDCCADFLKAISSV